MEASSYALNISRLESTRSIKGCMPSSLEMARDSSSRDSPLQQNISLVVAGPSQVGLYHLLAGTATPGIFICMLPSV